MKLEIPYYNLSDLSNSCRDFKSKSIPPVYEVRSSESTFHQTSREKEEINNNLNSILESVRHLVNNNNSSSFQIEKDFKPIREYRQTRTEKSEHSQQSNKKSNLLSSMDSKKRVHSSSNRSLNHTFGGNRTSLNYTPKYDKDNRNIYIFYKFS